MGWNPKKKHKLASCRAKTEKMNSWVKNMRGCSEEYIVKHFYTLKLHQIWLEG